MFVEPSQLRTCPVTSDSSDILNALLKAAPEGQACPSQVVGRVQRSRGGREELDLRRDVGPRGLVCLPRPRLLSGCAYLLNTDLLYFCCMQGCCTEKAMATHSSTLAWEVPWAEEPGRLQSMGSRRVRHD